MAKGMKIEEREINPTTASVADDSGVLVCVTCEGSLLKKDVHYASLAYSKAGDALEECRTDWDDGEIVCDCENVRWSTELIISG